ncbi:MAG: FAD-dependent oxidoreductase [Candidatus Hydrogenedentes bacterium]|nr:FAD-dependent oxidoreductase [Candidatus Hydrogenedentota bacterium]
MRSGFTRNACLFWVILLGAVQVSADNGTVFESARNIPMACDADVVVVCGSLGAAGAAIAAAQDGARVFLATPHPYLGEDVCATYRLWLEPGEDPATDLERALFAPPKPSIGAENGLAFSYTTDIVSAELHRDSNPPRMLADGKAGNAAAESVQYDADVAVTADLGRVAAVGRVHVLAYQRLASFEVASVSVQLSADGLEWGPEVSAPNPSRSSGNFEEAPLAITVDAAGDARYVRVTVSKNAAIPRLLLGEIIIEPKEDGAAVAATGDARTPPMPMQVKRTLEHALIAAQVTFLYGCYATDVLRDEDGQLAGIVMANRSGRQAVRAKCIVDASPRGAVARMAGAVFGPYPAGEQEFRRTVIGGGPRTEGVAACRTWAPPVQLQQGGWGNQNLSDAYEYTLRIPMADGSYAAFARAEQVARDLTWHPGQLIASETLFQTPPDTVRARKRHTGAEVDAETIDLDIFRPQGVDRIFVLGGCADMDRQAAERLLRPLTFLRAGQRLGAQAAATARSIGEPGAVRVAGGAVAQAEPGEVREPLTGPRSLAQDLQTVPSEGRALPVLARYDVVVVGGGTGGAPAGIAAARQGARTLVIEYQYNLGGVGTLGLIGKYYYSYLKGFTEEVDQGVAAISGPNQPLDRAWNVEAKMEWYRRELCKAGADIWFGAIGCGTVAEGDTVKGVVVATPDGRGAVLADVVIDATGNADIAHAAGAACMAVGDDNVAVQGTGMPPRRPGANYTNTDYTITDDSDTVDFWRTLVAGREKYRDAFDLGVLVDSRERRRIVGDFVVSPLDIWNLRTYPDTIGLSRSNFDTHGFTVHALFALEMPGEDEVIAHTPYRALLPRGIEGMLVTGLGISAHRDAMPILRMQGDIQNQGYAAGCAAAMAAKAGVPPRSIDVKALQRLLVEKGNVPESVLTDRDSYPLSLDMVRDAVESAADNYRGVAVLLAQPAEALPLLRDAYRAAEYENARLIYAHILGMLDDPAGADTLARTVAGQGWDEGWSFTGGGQFGGSLSRLDSLIIALARTGAPGALEVILEKARTLDAESAFSHHRATAIAAETLGRPDAAPVLAALLRKPGMTGHACLDIEAAQAQARFANPNQERDCSIRELMLARALYRCGDADGLGESILRTYAADLRGHMARHAQAVLGQLPDTTAIPGTDLDMERWPVR